MQRPATLKPARFPESRTGRVGFIVFGYVDEIDVAYLGTLIPFEHGINCLRQLGATALVDTAGVDPHIIISIVDSLSTATFNLSISRLLLVTGVGEVLEYHLILTPCM